eukprot:11381147-Karenia_brevis.AAC.1
MEQLHAVIQQLQEDIKQLKLQLRQLEEARIQTSLLCVRILERLGSQQHEQADDQHLRVHGQLIVRPTIEERLEALEDWQRQQQH